MFYPRITCSTYILTLGMYKSLQSMHVNVIFVYKKLTNTASTLQYAWRHQTALMVASLSWSSSLQSTMTSAPGGSSLYMPGSYFTWWMGLLSLLWSSSPPIWLIKLGSHTRKYIMLISILLYKKKILKRKSKLWV